MTKPNELWQSNAWGIGPSTMQTALYSTPIQINNHETLGSNELQTRPYITGVVSIPKYKGHSFKILHQDCTGKSKNI